MENAQFNNWNITSGEGVNPKKECLTVERLRQFPGLEKLTDKEAEEMVLSIRMFSKVILSVHPHEEENNSEEIDITNYKTAA